MKDLKKYLKKDLNEDFDTKADELMEKIKKMEMEEAYGDEPGLGDNTSDFDFDKFKKNIDTKKFRNRSEYDSMYPPDYVFKQASSEFEDEEDDEDDDIDNIDISGLFDDIQPINENETCEQCGSMMSEGECMECGYKQMNESTYDLNDENEFDYVQEEEGYFETEDDFETDEDIVEDYCNKSSDKYDEVRCQYHQKLMKEEISEKLYGNQSKLDKNKNGKIDSEDFHLLRKSKKEVSEKWEDNVEVEKTEEYSNMSIEEINDAIKKLKKQNEKYQEEGKKVPQINKEKMSELYFAKRAKQGWKGKGKAAVKEDEMEEGNKFTGMLAKARKGDKFTIDGKTYTDKSNYDLNENIKYHIQDNEGDIIELSENELVNLIENIINEQKVSGLKTIGKPRGLTTYEKAHKGSGQENKEYFKSFEKKMKDYLKDGSKGKFDMNPKMFPKGNGELGKMDKKAFKMTDELEDFNYEIAGQNFPTPDAIDYNEEWMEKLFKGDSMTGNAPGGNALESETNDRFNKMRKKNTLKKLKDQSYKRVPQPVFNEKSGSEKGKGLNIKLESSNEKKKEILKEEFDRMKELFKYNRKTQ